MRTITIVIIVLFCVIVAVVVGVVIVARSDYDEYYSEICPEGFKGIMPDPNNCKRFYRCENDIAILLVCGDTWLFDSQQLTCRPPHLVRCNNRPRN
ncbi:ORF59 [Betabaculovirus altermyunipunctae]|uniref:ORF59 n=1 Tax=Betabaculovirus altermyunipunctae TaxID=3051996 RepID=A0A1S5YE60_9BBAC|nr:ORF59 [Betabaculovirus altermyunipunctae]AQQ80326.1 ORF59 [Betabaculovirus altermyunipunctae]